jgi:putative FmdB family regulatory protein
MPTYDYECAACGRRFEVVHGVHANSPTECPLCGKGPVRKVITAANVHYKGSGWAKKERRSTAASGASKSGSGAEDASKDGSKSEAAASSDADGSGSPSKKSETGSTGAGTSKATEKTSTSGASKTD